jgi:hypothetical protein
VSDAERVLRRLGASRYARGTARPETRLRSRRFVSESSQSGSEDCIWHRHGRIPWREPIAQEFPQMVEFGMTPMEAIQSATSRAAELLDRKGLLGVIGPGRMRMWWL